jgi:23S rRNA (adenine2503-C2)-methyltransferase
MIDIRDRSREELVEWLASLGEPPYRTRQLLRWSLRLGVLDPSAMTDLPRELRARLAELVQPPDTVFRRLAAADGSVKVLLACGDGVAVECVVLRHGYGYTACVSSQAGCAMGCAFCQSGRSGLIRDLTAAEMVGQVLTLRQETGGHPVNRIVVMGGGEPLANLDQTLRFLRRTTSPDGLGLSPRRVVVSTCGLVPGILTLAAEGPPVTLSVSLHAATDQLRDQLVPVNRRYPLVELLAACRHYQRTTGRRVTAEYVLAQGVNDRPEDAGRLASLIRGVIGHVNLIPLNPIPGVGFERPSDQAVAAFAQQLLDRGMAVTIRRSLGMDIGGACGQLRATVGSAGEGTGRPAAEPGEKARESHPGEG